MPPSTHSWVRKAQQGYPRKGFSRPAETPEPRVVPRVSPAWQALPNKDQEAAKEPLEIPKALDHRYFVMDPPQCFRESLFERQDDDSEGEEFEEAEADQ